MKRRGFTLLEVLISSVVVMVGILGVASLIPASKYQINEAIKADMAANVGRAAIKTLITMGAGRNDFGNGTLTTLNRANEAGMTDTYVFNWRKARDPNAKDSVWQDFFCEDDLVENEAKRAKETDPPYYDMALEGRFEWIGTVRRLRDSRNSYCEVSAAVSFQRPDTASQCSGSHMGDNQFTISLRTGDSAEFAVGRWVYVYNAEAAHWYRIADISWVSNPSLVQLEGPKWSAAKAVTIVTPGNVIGAYTEIIPIYTH